MKELFAAYLKQYSDTLNKEVMPFWLKYAIDETGAINNCLNEDGTLISRNRYIWSQVRALWTFSAMYNRVEKKEEYRKIADGLFNYLKNIGANERGHWNFLYDGDGNLLETDISIFVDSFVIAGMTEYYVMTGNEEARDIAVSAFENTWDRITHPGSYDIAPDELPAGMVPHGVNMIFTFFYHALGKATGRQDILDAAHTLAMEILNDFYIKEKDAIVEFINLDRSYSDTPPGRTCIPGHVLEGMWFMITIFEDWNETENIKKCCALVRRHVELGMDPKLGGLIHAIDVDGKSPIFCNKPDCMPWWVQVEALVATAYAYKHTKDTWYLDAHKTINAFTFSRYPTGYGDWYNWLDANGNVVGTAALPVKDPFHLPRALIYMNDLFGKQLPELD